MDKEQSEFLTQIEILVSGCGVSDSDKQIFNQTVLVAPVGALRAIIESFSDDSFGMRRFIENVVKKHNARGNVNKMKEILAQDKYELDSLLTTINE